MMTCRECAELLLDFLGGELDAERCERLRQHLEACPPCLTYVETYQITIRLTRRLSYASLPPDVAERLLKSIQDSLDADDPESGTSC
jgi:anti-sigma factor (TIGR02949 family)